MLTPERPIARFAAGTAALMLYVALNFMAERRDESIPPAPATPPTAPTGAVLTTSARHFLDIPAAEPTPASAPIPEERMGFVAASRYDEPAIATGLSRSRISQGLGLLQELQLITPEGSRQKRIYRLTWGETKWFKLPCSAIVTNNVIEPFRAFTLHSKYEFHTR